MSYSKRIIDNIITKGCSTNTYKFAKLLNYRCGHKYIKGYYKVGDMMTFEETIEVLKRSKKSLSKPILKAVVNGNTVKIITLF